MVDNVEKKEVRMVCFPTDKIIVDYSTKPTQGTLFKVHRNTIMGMSEDECGMCKG